MKIEHELSSAVREWLRSTRQSPYSAQQTVAEVIKRLPDAKHPRRRRWGLSWRRTRADPDRVEPHELRPAPFQATAGHSATVTGRTQIMFSPGTVVIAGALAFAIGGALYIAQPVEQPAIAPAAQGEPTAPTWVTGSMQQVEDSCSETGFSNDGSAGRHSYECTFTWTSSDPRLTGNASRPWNEDSYQTDEGPISVSVVANYLKNDGGDWTCSTVSLLKGSTPTSEPFYDGDTYLCIGGGGYEGLSAVLVSKYMADSFGDDFSGLILSGELPPLPEAPTAE
jgi:hypothetical protein